MRNLSNEFLKFSALGSNAGNKQLTASLCAVGNPSVKNRRPKGLRMTSLAKQSLERGDIPTSTTEAIVHAPGFSWEQILTAVFGVLWSLGFGGYVAVLFGVLYKAFGEPTVS